MSLKDSVETLLALQNRLLEPLGYVISPDSIQTLLRRFQWHSRSVSDGTPIKILETLTV